MPAAIMVNIIEDIELELTESLASAQEVWVAVAMMNRGGLKLFENLKGVVQHHIVGIDLPTPPKTLERLRDLCTNSFSAKVWESRHTFHPKLYIIKDQFDKYCAFVGSSNATYGGLKSNIELNVRIIDQRKCHDLINWYRKLDRESKIITNELIDNYRKKFKNIKKLLDQIEKEVDEVKADNLSQGQFFRNDHHAIFGPEYQKITNNELKKQRKNVRDKLIELHHRIYPKFQQNGISELYENPRNKTSKFYISPFSGLSKHAIWLHYGKSQPQLSNYTDEYNKSFVNHVRMQVIIHDCDIGIWLVLGKDFGSEVDRLCFKERMQNANLKKRFLSNLQGLDDSYWIKSTESFEIKKIKTLKDVDEIIESEQLFEYFIIGKTFDPLNKLLSEENIATTVLSEFKKLHPLYEIMNSEIN